MSSPGVARLLIVEDDPEIRFLLTAILDDDDREIVAVETATEAEEAAQERPFDLIVLDLILPDMDGRTWLRSFREHPEASSTAIVVISGRGGPDVRHACLALGADAFWEKPFDPDELADDIAVRLERSTRIGVGERSDSRTGLLNRAGILARHEAGGERGTLGLVQLDGFMSLPERWGWDLGDKVLGRVGEVLRAHVMEEVTLGRLGGGDFVVLFGGVDVPRATEVAERILEGLRSLSIEDPTGEPFRLTASIAIVAAAEPTPLDDLLDEAHRRLFRAHESGRNQVVTGDAAGEERAARVLVAEDDEISATILLHRLEKEGLDIVRYDNGKDAYEGALRETPDLVILDVKMPGMDGFEVLERLRRTPSYASVPIILLTSMGSEADVVRGFQLGADDYVLKPFSPIELSARVWRLLRRGRTADAL